MKVYRKFSPLYNLESGKFDTFVFTGGRGSMKTGSVCRAVLFDLMKHKNKRAVVFREIMRSINESLYAELTGLVDGEFSRRGFYYDSKTIRHKNGSKIFFMGLKDRNVSSLEAIKGIANVDICVVDEAQAVSKACWDVLLPTLRKDGVVLMVIYNRIENDLPVEEALGLDYHTMSAPQGTYFAEVNYPEIVHLGFLSTAFLKRAELKKLNKPEEYERDYLNKPRGGNLNRVVKYWDKDNVDERIRYCADMDLHLSMDFNVDPMMWVCCHKTKDKLFVFDEIVMENATTQDAADEFVRRYPAHKGRIILNGDASGSYRKTQSKYSDYAIVKNTLLKAGYSDKNIEIEIHRSNPPIAARVNAFNRMVFADDAVRYLKVHPSCKWLIYNMVNLKYKPGTSSFELPTSDKIRSDNTNCLKFLGHIFDAVSYCAEYYWPIWEKDE